MLHLHPKSKISDYICLEILEEIIKKLPVKSLIRFRSVSKPWKSLIDSFEFIAAYSHHHTQPQHMIVRYKDPVETKKKYVCFVDDHTFPNQKFAPTLPSIIEILPISRILGSSHGLLCLYGYYSFPDDYGKKGMAVIWNPSIRKSVAIVVSDVNYPVLGFGVCPVTLDPKIVKITRNDCGWQVEVYTLSSREWRSVSTNLPRQTIELGWSQVTVNRFIYWSASDIIPKNGEMFNKIISFDTTTDGFREIDLPNCLASYRDTVLVVSKLWESLAVLEMECEKRLWSVWMMDHSTSNSFSNLFIIKTSSALTTPLRFTKVRQHLPPSLGFTKSGEPIMEVLLDDHREDCYRVTGLAVYEPHSKHITDLGIQGGGTMFSVNSYTESLLLLDQPDTLEGTAEYP